MEIKYEKQYEYSAVSFDGINCGVGILNPTTHNYEDLFADMYVKVVDFIGEKTSRVCTCKLKSNLADDRLWFRHNNRKYFIDDFMKIAF